MNSHAQLVLCVNSRTSQFSDGPWRSDIYNLKSQKYVCITTNKPDTKPNPNPNRTTKQHAIVTIQVNIDACPKYADKFIQDMLLHRLGDFRL